MATRAARATGRARAPLLAGGLAFIRLPVMTFSSSRRDVAHVEERLEDAQRPDSTVSTSERMVTSGEEGGSYGSVMPTKFGISPASAFLYFPVESRWMSFSVGQST